MANTWTYRENIHRADTELSGFDVEATDGGIGKVDEATSDRDHIIVDTGFWIFGKRRLLPAGVVTRVDYDDEKVYVDMTKDQIKEAPDLDETVDRTSGDWDRDRDRYTTYFEPYIW
jgi:hypothetical protein